MKYTHNKNIPTTHSHASLQPETSTSQSKTTVQLAREKAKIYIWGTSNLACARNADSNECQSMISEITQGI